MMKNKSPISKLLSAVLICMFCGAFLLACKKDDLDLDDPTVYKWEVTETWLSFLPNYDDGDLKVDLGERKLVAKVDILWLTDAEVHKLKQEDKKNKAYKLEFKKLPN